MSEQPAILVRLQIPDEYRIGAVQLGINDLLFHLEKRPAVLFNFYAQRIGVEVKEFKYTPQLGYFVDIENRIATHMFECKGVARRDTIFEDKYLQPLVPEKYRFTFFNKKDAERSYIIPITNIEEVEPIPISQFKLWDASGNVSPSDVLHHPRPVHTLH